MRWHEQGEGSPRTTSLPRDDLVGLLGHLRSLIAEARQQAVRAVDAVQVRTCWEVGRHIVEFEQGGSVRATYGQGLIPRLAEALSREFGKGFDTTNLRHMRLFYKEFPIRDALRRELSWTHYRILLRVEEAAACAQGCSSAGCACW